jgi:WD40 repeat protein
MEDWATAVAWSPDSQKLAIGTFEQILIWDRAKKRVVTKLPVKYGVVKSLLFSPDGTRLYSGCYQYVETYNMETMKRQSQLKVHRSHVTGMILKPAEQQLITSSDDQTVILWDLQKGIPLQTIHADWPVYGIALSSDQSSIAIAMGDETRVTEPGHVDVHSLETGKTMLKEPFPEQKRYASAVLFSQDQKKIISGSNDAKCYVYDISTNQAVGFFGGHVRPITAMVSVPGTQQIISVSGGRTKGKNELHVWDYETGDDFLGFEPHTDMINAVALSPDGTLIATGGQDKTAIIWDAKTILPEAPATTDKPEEKIKPDEKSKMDPKTPESKPEAPGWKKTDKNPKPWQLPEPALPE